MTCAQALAHGWILWHHLGPGWWWTLGAVRDLPAHAPPCPPWVYSSPTINLIPEALV